MYITKNAVYLHVPKTAGTWMELIILPKIVASHDTNLDFLPDTFTHCFAAVRNPWEWYVSLYKFCINGSEIEMPLWPSSIMKTINRVVNFEEFIKILSSPTQDFKQKLINTNREVFLQGAFIDGNDWPLHKRLKNTFKPIAREWVNNDKGFYNHVFSLYSKHATYIGRFENLNTDLRQFIIKVGDITPEIENNLKTIQPINVTKPCDYRLYYTEELKNLVYESNKSIIKQYNYKF